MVEDKSNENLTPEQEAAAIKTAEQPPEKPVPPEKPEEKKEEKPKAGPKKKGWIGGHTLGTADEDGIGDEDEGGE